MRIAGKKIFVLGAARSGIAGALLAKSLGATVFVSDRKNENEIRDTTEILTRHGIEFETGNNSFGKIREFDLLLLSPGVKLPEGLKRELKEQNIPVLSELEFAYRFIDIPVIAVTGTNGKSTTTALIGHILNSAGISAFVGGNIGNALSNLPLDNKRYDVAVAEVSSFMLEDIEEFRPHITVFTNLSPDHLDRYSSYQEYIDAKLNIFRNLQEDSPLVLNYDCADLVDATKRFAVRKVFFSRDNRNASVFASEERDGFKIELVLGGSPVSLLYKNHNLVGLHNLENVLAASAAALLYGAGPEQIENGINSFKGLSHRIELVAEINGIRFYNDSKATNVDSAYVALSSFEKGIIWIAGGRHKGTPYTQLSELVRKRVKKIIAIGEAAPIILKDLGGIADTENWGADFEGAVRRGLEVAEPDDVVLLSPACSSYDMFKNYEERGERFREIIRKLEGKK